MGGQEVPGEGLLPGVAQNPGRSPPGEIRHPSIRQSSKVAVRPKPGALAPNPYKVPAREGARAKAADRRRARAELDPGP